jgi:16S rRNA (adenine1518-N6/adenine1519-N6)-dimethyltransferase
MNADPLPPLREVIRRHGLEARKSLGQNFILDLNLTRKIARAAGMLPGETVIEIGPGPGGLTRGLLTEGSGRVIAIERDERCLPALAEIAAAYPGRLQVIAGDAMETDQRALAAPPVSIVANLPYAAATLLLLQWLGAEPWPPWYRRLTLMFQLEVAERIVAPPGGKDYGRLAVLAQWRCEPRILFRLPPAAFVPPPKVHSAVVQLEPRQTPLAAGSLRALERVTAAAFGQRRKMLRSSLKPAFAEPEAVLERLGIDPQARAEQIAVADFCRLAAEWSALHAGNGGVAANP